MSAGVPFSVFSDEISRVGAIFPGRNQSLHSAVNLRLNLEIKADERRSVLVGALIIVVAGAICFWVIDRFAADGRLKKLLRPLVVRVPWAIVQRVLTLTC
jgi:hypothetical protein